MSKLDDYEFKNAEQQVVDFKDDLRDMLNNGKYQSSLATTGIPGWNASAGEFAFYSSGSDRRLYLKASSSGTSNSWQLVAGLDPTGSTSALGTAHPGTGSTFSLVDHIHSAAAAQEGGWNGMEVFGASSTWALPTGVTVAYVRCWGGGGGGGGAQSVQGGAGGGGGGGYAEGIVAVSNNITVTVGGGGAGGIGRTSTGDTGAAGGTSSFANLVIALGGAGGPGGNSGSLVAGGVGGAGSSGTLLLTGGDGGSGIIVAVSNGAVRGGGDGGNSAMGGQGGAGGVGSTAGAGKPGVAPGGGGGGGQPDSNGAVNGGSGGAGAAGAVVVYWSQP